MDDFALYRRLAHQAAASWQLVAVSFLVSLLASPLALLAPIPLKIAVDSVIGSRPAGSRTSSTPGNGRRAIAPPAGSDVWSSRQILQKLEAALLALRAEESVDLTAAYLKGGYDRGPLVQVLATAACKIGNDPHNQELGLCTLEDYLHTRAHDRERLLLASAQHTAGHRKYGDPLEAYRRFAEALGLDER